ncbi:MAG: hypothetical protein ACPL25_09450 [Ignavibacteria bacterium]
MLRLIYFLFMMYLIYRALRYFYRLFGGSSISQKIKQEKKEVIDVDYEEVNEDETSSKKFLNEKSAS